MYQPTQQGVMSTEIQKNQVITNGFLKRSEVFCNALQSAMSMY